MTRKQAGFGAMLAPLISMASLAFLALAAGCGTTGGSDGDATGRPGSKSTTPPPQAPAKFTAEQLREALLTEFDELAPSADIATGEYGSLPITPSSSLDPKNIPSGVDFQPEKCRGTIWSGPDLERFRRAPTAFIQMADPKAVRAGKDTVLAWDILIATSDQPKEAALGKPVPGCPKVKTTFKGSTMTLEEKTAPKIGSAGRAVLLTPSGKSGAEKSWIVTTIGNGFIAMAVLQGPADQKQVDDFATQAFEKAQETLG